MSKIGAKIRKFHNKTISEKITFIVYFIFFVFAALVFLYPIYYTFLLSISKIGYHGDDDLVSFWQFFWVKDKTQFDSWKSVVKLFSITTDAGEQNLLKMLWNSIWFTVLKTGLSLAASAILAYAVSKYRFPGRNLIYVMAVFVQTIPIFGTGAASIKLFVKLNMMNNPTLFWMAWVTGFDFTFIIMHGAFNGVSNAYSESARIDGANNLTILLKIILPMVTPILLALFISNSLGVWNDYSTIQVYLKNYPTMAYGLFCFQKESFYVPNATAISSCATIISAVPIIIIYACSQKLILTNISVGGLKG